MFKKRLTILLAATTTALLGTACDRSAEGTIQVIEQLRLIDKKGRELIVPAGGAHSKIEIEGDKPGKQVLKIKLVDYVGNGGNDFKMELKIPANVPVPTENGVFTLAGASVGQSFDLAGAVNTDRDRGPQVRGTESCSYTERERVCERVKVQLPEGRHRYDTVCKDQTVTRYGEREIEYHDVHTHVQVDARFLSPGGSAVLATFRGDRAWSTRYTDYSGPCMRDRYPHRRDRYPY